MWRLDWWWDLVVVLLSNAGQLLAQSLKSHHRAHTRRAHHSKQTHMHTQAGKHAEIHPWRLPTAVTNNPATVFQYQPTQPHAIAIALVNNTRRQYNCHNETAVTAGSETPKPLQQPQPISRRRQPTLWVLLAGKQHILSAVKEQLPTSTNYAGVSLALNPRVNNSCSCRQTCGLSACLVVVAGHEGGGGGGSRWQAAHAHDGRETRCKAPTVLISLHNAPHAPDVSPSSHLRTTGRVLQQQHWG